MKIKQNGWTFRNLVGEKMSAGGKPVCSHMRILTDSAQKRNRKEVLANYNKTRINIGPQHNLDGIEGSFESTNSY
jgi:hypothetical protein